MARLNHGLGKGYKIKYGLGSVAAYKEEYIRPPFSAAVSQFVRATSATNWTPMPFGSEGGLVVTGTGAATSPSPVVGAAAGVHGVVGTGAGTISLVTGSAAGDHGTTGTAAGTLPNASAVAQGSFGSARRGSFRQYPYKLPMSVGGEAQATMPMVVASDNGIVGKRKGTIPTLRLVVCNTKPLVDGKSQAVLPSLSASAAGRYEEFHEDELALIMMLVS